MAILLLSLHLDILRLFPGFFLVNFLVDRPTNHRHLLPIDGGSEAGEVGGVDVAMRTFASCWWCEAPGQCSRECRGGAVALGSWEEWNWCTVKGPFTMRGESGASETTPGCNSLAEQP
ncbi:hypothetical protein BKA70DRAFT_1232281 [Coprinopsis sp. MPI-PUGE-AT-0042]|nr:hypothetical protein BKA70DRAFT_1232281 [Coprinopsis sp. MPI-PUGE-AT-0042]